MVKAIDVHAHVFNLKYLPVAAILNHSGLANLPRPLANAVAKAALALTKDDSTLDGDTMFAMDAANFQAEAAAGAEAKEMRDALDDFDTYVDRLEQELPDSVREDPDVRQSAAGIGFAAADAPGGTLRGLIRAMEEFLADGRQYAKWVFAVATQRERAIVQLLLDTYGAEVDIFVHHMMDMKSFYRRGTTTYEFHPRQVDRMRNLSDAYPERLIAFTAWDPFRPDSDWLDTIKDAIENRGCRGVKVYPPSGYRPVGNDESNRHPRVQSPAPEEIDRRNVELFAWCARRGVPVFTHCTPEGFEGYGGAGSLNSSPAYWRSLLEREGMRNLKLCFGHAGGEVWFAPDDKFNAPDSFAAEVIRLCNEFDNVCCEFGILDHIHDEGDFRRVRDRLGSIIAAVPRFGDRILYGSDWHMLYMHRHHEDFFRNYTRLFNEPNLAPHAADFFRNNAIRYLGLPESLLDED